MTPKRDILLDWRFCGIGRISRFDERAFRCWWRRLRRSIHRRNLICFNVAAMDGSRNHRACNYPRIAPFQAACYESWWKIGNG